MVIGPGEDLSEVQRADRMIRRGAPMHPPLSEQAVLTFETRHKVTLPDEYRAFVTTVGNGGEGPPEYGLMRLGEVPEDYDLDAEEHLKTVGRPFPFKEKWIWEGADETPATKQLQDSAHHGALVLGTEGCGLYWLLVLTGGERGQIWQLADVGVTPLEPRRTFLSWYEDWLVGGRDWWGEN